jgi:RNA polymerase sigma-70 factor (ECF subfamily)
MEDVGDAPTVAHDADARTRRFRALVDAHHEFAHRSLRRLGVPAANADDALQSLWCVVLRRLDDIEEPAERAFIFGTAMRVASDERRARGRKREIAHETVEDLRTIEGPDVALDDARARALLDAMLDELPMELRAVFVLFEIEEIATPEIARMLGLPLGTATSRLRRAREKFDAIVKRFKARGGGPR